MAGTDDRRGATTRRLVVTAAEETTGKRVGLAPEACAALGVSAGDAVTVEGGRETAALVATVDAVADDEVALGPTARRNAGVEPGEGVDVAAVAPATAGSVVLAPVQSLALRGGEAAVRAVAGEFPLLAGDRVRLELFDGALTLPFVVVRTDPEGVVVIGDDTDLTLREAPADDAAARRDRLRRVTLDDVGGLDDAVARLREVVGDPLEAPEAYETYGRPPTTGVVVGGPTGVGKTHLIHGLVGETGASYVPLDGAALAGRGGDDARDRIADAVSRARREAPAVVHVTDLGTLAPPDPAGADAARVRALADLAEEVGGDPAVAVVGETRDPDAVAEGLRRGGRLETTVELGVPGPEGRAAVLRAETRGLPVAGDVDLDAVARRTHGFVGADLAALCRAAVAHAVGRESGPDAVAAGDFEAARETVGPSAMRGFTVSVPEVTYDDVGGLDDAKRELARAVEWPLAHPELFAEFGTKPARGILLYGPPGTGKTMLARAVANATDANFISVEGPELLDKFVGESERAVREVFRAAERNAPAVVFFDEIDAITTVRSEGDDDGGSRAPERVVSQLLTELDGVEELSDVTVVGATNRPDRIDPALLRPGRLERVIEVPMPDRAARREILKVHAAGKPLAADVDLDAVADRLEGYTGSDIEAVVREAALLGIEARMADGTGPAQITAAQFDRAVDAVGRSVDADQRDYYERVGDRI
jgi:transitional endoplasmic reticulum ATPase